MCDCTSSANRSADPIAKVQPNIPWPALTAIPGSNIPMIGCDCEVCSSSDPRDKRTRCSVYIEIGGNRIIVDTGPDFRAQMLREGFDDLDAHVAYDVIVSTHAIYTAPDPYAALRTLHQITKPGGRIHDTTDSGIVCATMEPN